MPISNDYRLLAEQRRRKILDLLEQKGQVTVRDLVGRFAVSAVTARGDLDALASNGSAVRSHGGAVRRLEASEDYPVRLKETLHREEKIKIGSAAADLVHPSEVIILDSGTTTAEVARQPHDAGIARSQLSWASRTSGVDAPIQHRGGLEQTGPAQRLPHWPARKNSPPDHRQSGSGRIRRGAA